MLLHVWFELSESDRPMDLLSVELVLGLAGLVILVSLAGELVFKRTGIPSVLFLMCQRRHPSSAHESVPELSAS